MEMMRGAGQPQARPAAIRGIFGRAAEPFAEVIAVLITVGFTAAIALGVNSLAERIIGG